MMIFEEGIAHPLRIAAALAKDWLRQRSRYTEVTNFDFVVFVDKYVGWFDVSVDYIGRVDEVQCT